MSLNAGLPNWADLLKDVRLAADVPEMSDLPLMAEYIVNNPGVGRHRLQAEILDQVVGPFPLTDAHHLISALPAGEIWNTNYDRLLEQAYADCRDRRRRGQDPPRGLKVPNSDQDARHLARHRASSTTASAGRDKPADLIAVHTDLDDAMRSTADPTPPIERPGPSVWRSGPTERRKWLIMPTPSWPPLLLHSFSCIQVV